MSIEHMNPAQFKALGKSLGLSTDKPKKQGESSVVDACRQWLSAHGKPNWRNTTGKRQVQGRWMAFGHPGLEDISAIVKDGRYCAIECKSKGGKQEPEQIIRQKRVEAAGGIYILAFSIDDLEARKDELV